MMFFRLLFSVFALLSLVSCAKLGQAHRFFLSSCAANGPEEESDFDIKFPEFKLDEYYLSIKQKRERFIVHEETSIEYSGKRYPIYRISEEPQSNKPRLLIVAGVHGNEQAALLAIPRIVSRVSEMSAESLAWELVVLTPVNPVGANFRSRYNSDGCDINRDFGAFTSNESKAIRKVINEVKPDLVIAPHEGPQSGFFMIATAATSNALASQLRAKVQEQGIELANKSFLGIRLSEPGLWKEGGAMSSLKKMIRLGSLGTYLDSMGIGTITTESSWSSADVEARIESHVVTIMALLEINIR